MPGSDDARRAERFFSLGRQIVFSTWICFSSKEHPRIPAPLTVLACLVFELPSEGGSLRVREALGQVPLALLRRVSTHLHGIVLVA